MLLLLIDNEDNHYNADVWNEGKWAAEFLISQHGLNETLKYLAEISKLHIQLSENIAETLLNTSNECSGLIKHATILTVALDKKLEDLINLAPLIHSAGFLTLWLRISVAEMTPQIEQLCGAWRATMCLIPKFVFMLFDVYK